MICPLWGFIHTKRKRTWKRHRKQMGLHCFLCNCSHQTSKKKSLSHSLSLGVNEALLMGQNRIPNDSHCKNVNTLILDCQRLNTYKKCTSLIYKHWKSDWYTSWICWVHDNLEMKCWNCNKSLFGNKSETDPSPCYTRFLALKSAESWITKFMRVKISISKMQMRSFVTWLKFKQLWVWTMLGLRQF